AAAVAFPNRPPDRLVGLGTGDPAAGENRDYGETPLSGLGIGEGYEAGFAKRVTAITGHHVQQIVHLAVALAEPDAVVARLRDCRDLGQPCGRQVLARHELVIRPAQRVRGQCPEGLPIFESVEQATALGKRNTAEFGFAKPRELRLQEIAAAAGISHPLILHHFGSREGLVRALTQEAVAELRDTLIASMGSPDFSLEQQLDQVFEAFQNGLAQRLAWLATIDPGG